MRERGVLLTGLRSSVVNNDRRCPDSRPFIDPPLVIHVPGANTPVRLRCGVVVKLLGKVNRLAAAEEDAVRHVDSVQRGNMYRSMFTRHRKATFTGFHTGATEAGV